MKAVIKHERAVCAWQAFSPGKAELVEQPRLLWKRCHVGAVEMMGKHHVTTCTKNGLLPKRLKVDIRVQDMISLKVGGT